MTACVPACPPNPYIWSPVSKAPSSLVFSFTCGMGVDQVGPGPFLGTKAGTNPTVEVP